MLPLNLDAPLQLSHPPAIEVSQVECWPHCSIYSFDPLTLGHLASDSLELAHSVQLNFSNLQPFERVQSQYQTWGIAFDGAIALQPSNTAFQILPSSMGLMPSCDRRPLSISFQQTRHWVSACLIGARRITVQAFNTNNQLVAEQHFGQTQYLQSPFALSSPVIQYDIKLAGAIDRIQISSDAPFMLQNLICG